MSSITGRTHVSRVVTGVFLTAIIALLALVSSSDTAHASFAPQGSAFIGNPEPRGQCYNNIDDDGDGKVNDGCLASADGNAETGAQCNNDVDDDGDTLINDGCPVVGNTSAGAAAGITSSFGVDAPDVNFGGTVGFTPNEWNIADGSAMPVGTVVGTLSSKAVLGLINNYCGSKVPVDFTFMNATTGGATIKPKPPGQDDPLEFFLNDDDGNGIPDGVDRYPSYLNLLFDPDYDGRGPDGLPATPDDDNGPLPPLVPKARYTGITYIVSAQTTVVLSFVVFEPGTTFPTDPPTLTDPSLGFPSVTVLQDPTAPPDPGAITDFCSPLTSRTVLLGETQDNPNTSGIDEGGRPFRVNPAEGAYNFVNYAVSQRDADGDGIENSLDPCPFNPDPDWDPRLESLSTDPPYLGDNDRDGIPNSCDPTPDQRDPIFPIDVDNDAFLNRGDNCPLIPNGENELQVPGVGVQLDTDSDGIGDACDTVGAGGIGLGPDEPDGEQVKLCIVTVLNIGAGGTPPSTKVQPCAEAQIVAGETTEPTDGGPGDADGDGVPDASDNCPNDANPDQADADGDNVGDACDTESGFEGVGDCGDGFDNDGDGDIDGADSGCEPLKVGMNLKPTDSSVPPGGSTELQAVCAEQQNSLQALTGVDITFKIDSQPPGSDANLDGEAEVTKTSDAEGLAKATLNVGSTSGDIVVCAEAECGTDCKTVTVTGEALGEVTGPGDAAGGAATGVGSLAPVAGSIPAWAAIASALGGAGLLGSLGALAARILRRRR